MRVVAAILSTPMLLEVGDFWMSEVSLEEAKAFVRDEVPVNFVGHSTVSVLGIEPATTREVCSGYDVALSLKVNGRLTYGVEYSVEDILALGVTCFLIRKMS